MTEKIREAIEFTVSLAFCIHKLILIYTSVFMQLFEAKEGEAYNG